MTTYTYKPIELTKQVRGYCFVCKAKTSKTFKVWQTINPFNNKTVAQVHTENEAKLKDIVENSQLVCKLCKKDIYQADTWDCFSCKFRVVDKDDPVKASCNVGGLHINRYSYCLYWEQK